MWDTFERIVSLTQKAAKPAIFAPFGPKTASVAMCLYATVMDAEVFYTQPEVYHPEYSSGVSVVNGEAEIYGYGLRVESKEYYLIGP